MQDKLDEKSIVAHTTHRKIPQQIRSNEAFMNSKNREYDFTLLLDADAITEELERALFEGGCDDATIALRFGCVYLSFTRERDSLLAAVISAIRDVRKAGFAVRRIDSCNLVTQAEIATRTGRSRQVIHNYVNGNRGPGGFPPPVCHIDDDHAPLWYWCEVASWLSEHDMISKEDQDQALVVDLVNNLLDLQRQKCLAPETAAMIFESLGALDCECK